MVMQTVQTRSCCLKKSDKFSFKLKSDEFANGTYTVEIKLKQGQHFLIPAGPFVHLWRMIFAGYCLKDLL